MTFFDVRQIYAHLDRINRHLDSGTGYGGRGRDYSHEFKHLEKLLMALDTNVQELVNQVANNNSLVASVIAGLKVESDQITALQAQVEALTAQIGSGQAIDAEDLTAITKAVSDLKDTNAQLTTAIPASTPGV